MAYSAPRNKRAVEDVLRSHDHSDYSQPPKKPRFDLRNPSALAPDALEDDATLEADVIGARGQQVKRGAVNIDGYDSDSDNDNFNARADKKAKAKNKVENDRSKDEEDNDMFADLDADFKDDDESEGDVGKGSGEKAVRFIDADEIEGQVQNSKAGGHVSADFSLQAGGRANGKSKMEDDEVESSTEEEVDDEMRADPGEVDPELGAGAKKSHAPKLDAFNMRTEQEEGRFDDQGNYVRKAGDPDAIHDIWLEGMSKKDMKKAKEAADKREEDRRSRELADDAKSIGDVLAELIPLLDQGETVLEALARLGKGKGKGSRWQKKGQGKDAKQPGSITAEEDVAEQTRKQKVEAITGAADLLLSKGQPEVYDSERELLIRQYRRETGTTWFDPPQPNNETDDMLGDSVAPMWEYRWIDARDGGTINGPYDVDTMKQWNDAGYFGDGVEFRRRDGATGWIRVPEFA